MLLHALIPASRANGPGLRAVVFFQGCKVGCVGCWNPRTHPFHGAEITVDAVAQEVLRARQEHTLEGITFSGGEPMQQADSLLRLIQCLHQQAPELSFGMFSGYAEHELDQGQYWIWGDGSSEQHRKRLWQEIRGVPRLRHPRAFQSGSAKQYAAPYKSQSGSAAVQRPLHSCRFQRAVD